MLIVIEGCDGTGKSTQLEMLVAFLRSRKIPASSYSFPSYESPTGRIIREHLHDRLAVVDGPFGTDGTCQRSVHDALVFQCLQTADKYAVAAEIRAKILLGQIVVCGRWWQSACVYSRDDGIDPDWLRKVHACMPSAGFNFLLDADPATASLRMRNPDRFDRDLDKQRRLRDAYLVLWGAMRLSEERWIVVRADGSKEEVHRCIASHLEPQLGHLFPSHHEAGS